MPFLDVSGYRAHVQTFGSGPRAALALHCGLAHGGAWGPVAAELGDLLTITAPDLPGHGKSNPWVDGDYAATSIAMAEAAAPEGKFDLIGHSYGGVTALALAVRMPERVRSLTLFEPVFFALPKAEGRPEGAENDAAFAPVVEAMEAEDWEAATRAFVGQWGGATPWEKIPEAQRDYMVARMHTVRAGAPLLHDDAGGILAPGALDRLTIPVLLMAGAASPPVVHAILDGLQMRLVNASRTVIDGAGHMAPVTKAVQVAEVMRGFLKPLGA